MDLTNCSNVFVMFLLYYRRAWLRVCASNTYPAQLLIHVMLSRQK